MNIIRVPKYRRRPGKRGWILLEHGLDGYTHIFIGWWKITYRTKGV